jgi:hypothetical protein
MRAVEEEFAVSSITGYEELARDEARRELVVRLLIRTCGALDTELPERVDALDQDRLLLLSDALLDFTGEADLRAWLDDEAPS